jgi:hypothetical protein
VIKLRRIRRAEDVACMGQVRNAYKNLFGRPKEMGLLGTFKRRREDNIKTEEDVDWIHVIRDKGQRWALANTVSS